MNHLEIKKLELSIPIVNSIVITRNDTSKPKVNQSNENVNLKKIIDSESCL